MPTSKELKDIQPPQFFPLHGKVQRTTWKACVLVGEEERPGGMVATSKRPNHPPGIIRWCASYSPRCSYDTKLGQGFS